MQLLPMIIYVVIEITPNVPDDEFPTAEVPITHSAKFQWQFLVLNKSQ